MASNEQIGLAKAILWEEAKGKLRAMVAAGGMAESTSARSPDWDIVSQAVEDFIVRFEENGFHE